MEFKDKIRMLREQNGMTQGEVAEAVGLKTPAIYKYEKGLIVNPKRALIEKLAKLFEVSPAYLLGVDTDNELPSFSYIHIPVGISAGKLEDCEGLSILPRMSVPDAMMGKYARDPHVVIMHVNGESMNRVIENGATIAVLTNIEKSQLRNGDIVVACTGPSYTVKRFYNDTGNRIIVLSPDSTDPEFGPITIPYDSPEELKIFGKVVMYSVIL